MEVWAGRGGGPGAPAATSNDRTYAVGKRYLVFASDLSLRRGAEADFGEGARWVDGACSATRPHDSSLNRFRPAGARPVSSETTSDGSVGTAIIVAAVVVVVAAAGTAIVLWRRSRAD